MSAQRLPGPRRPTLYFLGSLHAAAPVFIDTEIDMTRVRDHRAASGCSVVSYLLWAAGRTLAAYPEANAAIRGRRAPRIEHYDSVAGKLTLDKTVGGQRVVMAAVLPGLETAHLAEVQRRVAYYRDADPQTAPEFAAARALHRLPVGVGRLLYALGSRPLSRRPRTLGTFALTSLGHRPVDGFHSLGGTTITLSAGRIADRPVVRDGRVTAAPLLRLTLGFDHRVVDGALAADVLTDLKDRLERFDADDPSVRETAGTGAAGAGTAQIEVRSVER